MRVQLAVLIVAATAAALASVSGAQAHARLKESTPAKGGVVSTPPSEVSITFTNEVQRIAGTYDIVVENDAGQSFTAGPATIAEGDRSVMSVPLQPNLPPGRYVVTYTNVSDADGDPFEGGYAFYVQVEPTQAQLAADALLEPPEIEGTQTPPAQAGTGTATLASPRSATPSVSSTPASNTGSDDDNGTLVTLVFIGAAVAAAAAAGFVIWRTSIARRAG